MVMNLQIRDQRARELAEALAKRRGTTMTEAVIEALEARLAELRRAPLADRLAVISEDLKRRAGPGGRDMTKDEIDTMWGHD